MSSSSGLTFTEKTHRYEDDAGVMPSVSQVLTMSGISDVSAIPVRNLERARDIGTAVHLACEFLDRDDLDFDSIDPAILGYVVGYQKFREEHKFSPELIEHRMVGESNGLRYGMTLDRVGTLVQNKTTTRILLDLKTGSRSQPSWCIQTAAYLIGYSAKDTESRPERGVVHLAKDGTYKLLYHTLECDFDVWRSALEVAWWKIDNGAKIK